MKRMALVMMALLLIVPVFAEESMTSEFGTTKVGGHIKLMIYDQPTGVSMLKTPSTMTSTASTSYTGMGFSEVILYISQELTDFFEVEFKPSFSASTGATPKFGYPIGGQRSTPSYKADLDELVIKYRAPWEVEIRAGVFKPVFTMEYGHELFWDEMMNGTKFSCNPNLAQMHEMAVEIYRPFTIGEVSLPVYLYVMNGNGSSSYYADNNLYPGGIAHIEPSWGPFTLSASIAAASTSSGVNEGAEYLNFKGKTNYHKWSVGGAVNWMMLKLRGEYVRGKWEKGVIGTAKPYDALSEGYYVTLSYRPFSFLSLFARNDVSRSLNFNGGVPGAKRAGTGETYITNMAGLDYYITDSSILEFQVDVADWRTSDGSMTVIFTRPTLGLRVTF